jgi:hypothetical protein
MRASLKVHGKRRKRARFGASGEFSPDFYPIRRVYPACTSDGEVLYLFGGRANSYLIGPYLHDLWVFSFSRGQWAWIHGDPNAAEQNAVYSKTPAAANIPMIRRWASLHVDAQNCLWVRRFVAEHQR